MTLTAEQCCNTIGCNCAGATINEFFMNNNASLTLALLSGVAVIGVGLTIFFYVYSLGKEIKKQQGEKQ